MTGVQTCALPISVTGLISNKINFLNSKIPRPKSGFNLAPIDWEPSDAEKQRFENYYEVGNDPMVVFKQMKDGALTTQSIEALNAMYPMLYTMMKATISQTLSPDHLKTMSYDKRRAIALFLGKPLDSSMIPQVMASNQLVYSQMGAAKAAQGETKTSKTGMEKMNVAGRASTKTERASVPREV